MRLLSSPLASYLSTAALLTLFFSPTALADVEFTVPAAGAEIPAGPITITFTEGAGSPSISQLSTYTLSLIVGGNEDTNQIPLTTITSTGKFSTGYTVTGNIAAGLAASTPNGLYVLLFIRCAGRKEAILERKHHARYVWEQSSDLFCACQWSCRKCIHNTLR